MQTYEPSRGTMHSTVWGDGTPRDDMVLNQHCAGGIPRDLRCLSPTCRLRTQGLVFIRETWFLSAVNENENTHFSNLLQVVLQT